MSRIATYIAASAIMLSMSGCFTGIESTPKITASDVKREKVAVTEEDRYLDNVRHLDPEEAIFTASASALPPSPDVHGLLLP